MVINPRDRSKIVSPSFPQFCINNTKLQYVTEFRYLGHIISSSLCDDIDIQREVRNMYARTNTMARRYRKCSYKVKVRLFWTYCICLYGVALWTRYDKCSLLKFRSCYNKCLKFFLGYGKYYSITSVLLESGLPSFDTVLHNYKYSFAKQWDCCSNALIALLRSRNFSHV